MNDSDVAERDYYDSLLGVPEPEELNDIYPPMDVAWIGEDRPAVQIVDETVEDSREGED